MDQNSSSSSTSSGTSMGGGGSQGSGTRDSTYDVVSVLYHALKGADLCQTYLSDANSDPELRGFFQQAQQMQRQLADQAKQCLQSTMSGGSQSGMSDGSGSAFRQFGSQDGDTSLNAGQSVGAMDNDPSMGLSGQSADGQGQRHSEMSTGGGGTTSF